MMIHHMMSLIQIGDGIIGEIFFSKLKKSVILRDTIMTSYAVGLDLHCSMNSASSRKIRSRRCAAS